MILTNCICKSTNEIHTVKYDGNLEKFGKLHLTLQTMIYMVKYFKIGAKSPQQQLCDL